MKWVSKSWSWDSLLNCHHLASIHFVHVSARVFTKIIHNNFHNNGVYILTHTWDAALNEASESTTMDTEQQSKTRLENDTSDEGYRCLGEQQQKQQPFLSYQTKNINSSVLLWRQYDPVLTCFLGCVGFSSCLLFCSFLFHLGVDFWGAGAFCFCFPVSRIL